MLLKLSWYNVVIKKFQSSFHDKPYVNDWIKFWLKSEIASWSWGQMVKMFKAEDLRDQNPHTTFLIDTDAGIKGLSNDVKLATQICTKY